MAEQTIPTKFKLRHDIASNWTAKNPILLDGEIGFETDTLNFKVGDGTTTWVSLEYYIPKKLSQLEVDKNNQRVSEDEKTTWNNKVAQVNGKTGNVVLSASDVGALPSNTEIPTVNNGTLTIQKNGTNIATFSANQSGDATANIIIPTTASDVSALPNSTKYGASLSLSMNTSTYVVTVQLKDQDGNNLGSAQTIDLPLESVVVSGAYNNTTKKVVLTLKDGSTVDFSVADLVSGLVSESSFNELEDRVGTNETNIQALQTNIDGLRSEIPDTSNLLPKSEKSHPLVIIRGYIPDEGTGQIDRKWKIFDEKLNVGDKVRLLYLDFYIEYTTVWLHTQECTGRITEVTSDYYNFTIISGGSAAGYPVELSNTFVALAYEQTITGNKTFSGTVIVPDVAIT
jgi:hypothetical protein